MKINGIIVCAMSFLTHLAFAQDTALITKINSPGFTLPEYARSETCELFQDKVIVTNTYGAADNSSVTNQKIYNIKLSGTILNVLEQSATESLRSSPNFLCDAPSTSIRSHHAGADTILFETGGCGSPRLVREGAATKILLDLITSYCPTVH